MSTLVCLVIDGVELVDGLKNQYRAKMIKTVLQGCGHELYDKASKTLVKSSPEPMTTVDSGDDATTVENEGEDSSVHNYFAPTPYLHHPPLHNYIRTIHTSPV